MSQSPEKPLEVGVFWLEKTHDARKTVVCYLEEK